MIGIITSPNSVSIPMIQTGCMKAEFDSTYPVHLNGIISQEEYRTSINKINRTKNSADKSLRNRVTVSTGILIGGYILSAVSPAAAGTNVFPALLGVGLPLTILGLILLSITICIAYRRVAHLRQVIVEESMKYSSRSPISCSWRLATGALGGYGGIVIDISHSTIPGNGVHYTNQNFVAPSVFFEQKNDHAPPSYSDQSTRFCPQCGTLQHDMTAKICSSCGQSFNKI